jgi:hypothetical protein
MSNSFPYGEKSQIKAITLADSISPNNHRISTFELTFPRSILAEYNTHRIVVRSAASSRAIPFSKMLQRIKEDPFVPNFWTKNQKGMDASEIITNQDEIVQARQDWLAARDSAIEHAEKMSKRSLHKQVVNRLLEPWMWVTIITTGTEWDNLFYLRVSKKAEPHFLMLALALYNARKDSIPKKVDFGGWHAPLIFPDEVISENDLPKISIARCARTSYLTHLGVRDLQEDLNLFGRLERDFHMAPFEHAATPSSSFNNPKSKQYLGWVPYRSNVLNENHTDPFSLENLSIEDREWIKYLQAVQS